MLWRSKRWTEVCWTEVEDTNGWVASRTFHASSWVSVRLKSFQRVVSCVVCFGAAHNSYNYNPFAVYSTLCTTRSGMAKWLAYFQHWRIAGKYLDLYPALAFAMAAFCGSSLRQHMYIRGLLTSSHEGHVTYDLLSNGETLLGVLPIRMRTATIRKMTFMWGRSGRWRCLCANGWQK